MVFKPKAPDTAEADRLLAIWATHAEEIVKDYGKNIAGFALVVWGSNATSVAMLESDGRIPSILVPDFVRNRLLARQIERWTIQEINGE